MILIDSSVLVALDVEKDAHHETASKLMARIVGGDFGSGVVTDYIFDETVTVVMSRSSSAKKAVTTGEKIKEAFAILKIDEDAFDQAWRIFRNQTDKAALSFTDCTTLAISQSNDIPYLATFDSGFKSANGLKVIGS